MTQMTHGSGMIADERARQINEEGFHEARDASYIDGELMRAAFSYLMVPIARAEGEDDSVDNLPEGLWPWDKQWWKPGDDIRCLVKAGALIAAEIDRRLMADADAANTQPKAV